MKTDISSCYISAKDLGQTYRCATSGMMVTSIAGGAWIDEDGQERYHGVKTVACPAKAQDVTKKAKSPIKAAFKKTATFKRINAVIGHDETLSAAILRFNEAERYADVLTLSDADLLEFAAATAAHRAINTNDSEWHVVKEQIIARFGFRL